MPRIKNGFDFDHYIADNLGIQSEESGWQLKRGISKNKKVKISGVVVSGRLTNIAIGIAISNTSNLIVILNELKNEPEEFISKTLEILYKNDIYVYSLGINWIFNSIIGKKILLEIFNGNKFSVWSEKLEVNNLLISFSYIVNLDSILQRFNERLIWRPKKSEEKIETVFYLDRLCDFDDIVRLKPNVLICHEMNSDIIDLCASVNIIFIWIHKDVILNEVTRELTHHLSRNQKFTNIKFSGLKVRKLCKNNGLDGI